MIRFMMAATLSFTAGCAFANERAPAVLVDEGACPFECCRYGPWISTQDVPAYASPQQASIVSAIPAGTDVTALTGYVRTVATPFVVNRSHGPYQPGDRLMVYTYQGEGFFTVWRDGEQYVEDLGFSPYGGTGGTRCTDASHCWGTLEQELSSVWWIKVRLADGSTVWVRGGEGFEGQDACG